MCDKLKQRVILQLQLAGARKRLDDSIAECQKRLKELGIEVEEMQDAKDIEGITAGCGRSESLVR